MNHLEKFLNHLEEALLALGIGVASIILFLNVMLRYFFNSGWEWAEEVARYSIVWIVFLGGSACVRKGMHLNVDAVIIRFSEETRRTIHILVTLVCIAFSIFLVVYGIELVELAYETDQRTPGLNMPIHYVYLAIPTGGALMTLRFVQDLYRTFTRTQRERTAEAS